MGLAGEGSLRETAVPPAEENHMPRNVTGILIVVILVLLIVFLVTQLSN